MNKNVLGLCLLGAATVTTGLAVAGYTSFSQVTFPDATHANGTIVGARQSADATQHIMCNTYAYASGNAYGSCFARNSAGTTKQCFAANPEQLAVMQSVGPASYISFTIAANGSDCDQISVTNGSARAQY